MSRFLVPRKTPCNAMRKGKGEGSPYSIAERIRSAIEYGLPSPLPLRIALHGVLRGTRNLDIKNFALAKKKQDIEKI